MAKDARGHGSDKREAWMGKYENAVTAAHPQMAGKVDWNAATYHFNSGKSPDEAAAMTINRISSDKAASELASGPKSAPAPIHDSMRTAADVTTEVSRNIGKPEANLRQVAQGRHGYSPDAVNAAIASSNRAGRRIGGREASAIHRLLKGR